MKVLKGRIPAALFVFAATPFALLSHPDHHGNPPVNFPSWDPHPESTFEPPVGEARITVTILDADDRPTPARVRITDEQGHPLGMPKPHFPINTPGATEARLAAPGSVIGLPKEAIGIMYGPNDTARGYAFQQDGAFYVNGFFDMPMPAGTFFITVSKGYEFVQETRLLALEPGDHLARRIPLRRWIDMPERGWYSADDHIHIRRSLRENPLIRSWIAAEDVHVGILLQMGDLWTTYFNQYAFGAKGRYGSPTYILTSGQEEPRTHGDLGHTISFGADEFVRFENDYYAYDRVFDRIHELGGVTGYAHQAQSFGGYRGLTLEVLDGKIDFLELAQFCRGDPLFTEHYYHMLDLGYKLTALAGSDFPWCGRQLFGIEGAGSQIGDARFYTYTGNPFSFDVWLDGVKAGRTFVTSGPMLDFTVNGELPGSSLDLTPGAKVKIEATAYGLPGQIPLERIQILGHGKVLAEATAGEPGQDQNRLSIELELEPAHGIWLAARADAGPTQTAHSTPVYVTVNGDGFHNRADLQTQVDIARGHLREILDLVQNPAARTGRSRRLLAGPWDYPGTQARLEQRIARAEKTLEDLLKKSETHR